MNQSSKKSEFVRTILRARYTSKDSFLGRNSGTIQGFTGSAKLYFCLGKPLRSKFIAGRFIAFNFSVFAGLLCWGLATVFVWMMVEDSSSTHPLMSCFLAALFLFLGGLSFWFALKSQSWIRWMVRHWNFSRSTDSSRSNKQLPDHDAGVKYWVRVFLEIIGVWFIHEFVRKHVFADYRPGDSIIILVHGKLFSRFYPEEFTASGKIYRSFMVLFTLVWLVFALFFLNLTLSDIQGTTERVDQLFFTTLLIFFSSWITISNQSFLRWMLRNWCIHKDVRLSPDEPTRVSRMRYSSKHTKH